MLVKDKVKTLQVADKTARKLIKLFLKKAEEINAGADPAEIIYLSAHTCASFVAKLALAMDGYNTIYGFDNFNSEVFIKWVSEIQKELLNVNQGVLQPVVNKMKEEANV